ncbi:MAG: hypothetical protein WD052_06120 [Bacteroidales bacterium]
MRIKLLLFLLVLLFLSACRDQQTEIIRASVEKKLALYPKSTLCDLYKSYFQDYFGPGHLIHDTAGARRYMEYELGMDDYRDTVMLSLTGYKGNFYRVNLQLIKDGTIPKHLFLNHFIESANAVEGISVETWKIEWDKIFVVIEAIAGDLPDFQEDKRFIETLINRGEYVVHHSEKYLEAYHPHYRIIHKPIFDEHLAGYLGR